MKIYINNFNIDLLSTIMNNIKEQYIDSETFIQIYAIDGIYTITNNVIQKCNSVDSDIKIHKNYFENFTLIGDPSYYTTEEVNKIPLDHISTKVKRCFYQINKKSDIKLVIEGPVIEESLLIKKPVANSNKDFNITPNDIYFELSDIIDINDALIKKELIVFLSMLN